MKLRKILATTLAIAMAVAAIPAVTAKADTIESGTAFLDTEVYNITLPTTSTQKFYIDPLGLSDKVIAGANNAGKIIGATTMSAINNSSKPVNFEVKANLVASSPAAITVVTTGALTTYDNVGSGPALRLDITAADGQLAGATIVTKGGIDGGTALSAAAETVGVAVSGAGITSVKYGMAPAGYQIVTNSAIDATKLDEVFDGSKYTFKQVSTGSSIDFTLGGECTKLTDWSAYSNGDMTLKLDITFKVTKENGTDEVELNKFSYNAGTNFYFFDIPGAAATSITAATFDGTDCMQGVTNGFIALNPSNNRIGIKSNAPFLSSVNVGDPHTFEFTLDDGRSFTVKFVKQ